MRIFVFSTVVFCCLAGTIQADIVGLGNLPGGDDPSSVANDVSSDGSVVVGRSSSSNGTEAFRWTQSGGMVGLGVIDGSGEDFYSRASGVSADGSVVVGASHSSEAFRWTQNGGMVGLGDLTGGTMPAADVWSQGYKVSADGSVVVGYAQSTIGGKEAFRWTENGGMVGLGDLPGGLIESTGISMSADGSVVVGESSGANGGEAFRWTETSGMVGLGGLVAGSGSVAWDVSSDGSVVVGGANEAFRWTENGGMVGLGDLPGGNFRSRASAVSDDGSTVVGTSHTGNIEARFGHEAFYWTQEQGMVRLYDMLADQGDDLSHWTTLYRVNEMSGDGRTIIGEGFNIDGNREAFVATLSSVLGDANDDGVLNNLDIASFVLALISPSAYEAMFPDVDPEVVLDMNGDGGLNNLDIASFVAALIG